LAEKGIVKPQDLVGKKVQLGGTNKVIFQALLATQGIDPAQVNQEDRTDYTIAPLVNGEADVIDAWVTNEVDILLLGGHEINFILASDYGIDLYPNVIFTTEETIAQNPDLVERFLRATIKGLEDSVASPEEATKLLLTYDKRPEDAALAAMQRSIPLINPPDSSLGMMSPEVWETTYKILEEQKVLPKPVDVKTAYTLDFLNKVHSQK
jgi:NitT/TauT family transport system substrate-binding protein